MCAPFLEFKVAVSLFALSPRRFCIPNVFIDACILYRSEFESMRTLTMDVLQTELDILDIRYARPVFSVTLPVLISSFDVTLPKGYS